MKRRHGGKRLGAGRHYSPWDRIILAWRYEEAKLRLGKAECALREVHASRKGSLHTTETLIKHGRRDDISLDIFLSEMDAKRHNGEPLTPGEQRDLRSYDAWRRSPRRKRRA